MDQVDVAVEIRDLASLLEAGAPQPSILAGRCNGAVASLTALRSIVGESEPLTDFIKAAIWNVGMLTAEGRATVAAIACESAQQLNSEYPEGNASWERLAQLPTIDDEYFRKIAKQLEDLASRLESKTDPDGPVECYVTLLQMGGIVGREKRTMRRLYDDGKLPPPVVVGGRGRQHEWRWDEVRPILEAEYNKTLPTVFPADRFVRS